MVLFEANHVIYGIYVFFCCHIHRIILYKLGTVVVLAHVFVVD